MDNLKEKICLYDFCHFLFMGFGFSTRFFKVHIMQSNVVQAMAQVMAFTYDKVNMIIIKFSTCMWWVIHASKLLFHSFNMEYLNLAWIMFLVLLKMKIVSSQIFSWIMKCNHTQPSFATNCCYYVPKFLHLIIFHTMVKTQLGGLFGLS